MILLKFSQHWILRTKPGCFSVMNLYDSSLIDLLYVSAHHVHFQFNITYHIKTCMKTWNLKRSWMLMQNIFMLRWGGKVSLSIKLNVCNGYPVIKSLHLQSMWAMTLIITSGLCGVMRRLSPQKHKVNTSVIFPSYFLHVVFPSF